MVKNIILNNFAELYLICDISGSSLFARKVWDMNPYPSITSNDFRALRLSNITSNGLDDSDDNIQHFFEFVLESSGMDACVKLYLKSDISSKIRKNASIQLKIKGKYGLSMQLTINIYTIEFLISVDSVEAFAYRNRKQSVAKLIYGYRNSQQNAVASLYNGVQNYRFSIITPNGIAFKDNANNNFVSTFDAEISAVQPYITANLFLIEKPQNISANIIVKVERLIGARVVNNKITTQSLKINFKDPPPAKLEIKQSYLPSEVYISPNETQLLRLELFNAGDSDADSISLRGLSCQAANFPFRFEPFLLPVIYPGDKIFVDVFLKPGKIKSLLDENVKATINFVHKDQVLLPESCTIELITQGGGYQSIADIAVKMKGERLLEIETTDYIYYPTDQVLSGVVGLKTKTSKQVSNVFVWLKEDNKDFSFDDNESRRLVVEIIDGLSLKMMNFSIALNENVQEEYTIVVAADYCEILEKSFHVTRGILVKAKPEVLSVGKYEKKCYLGGLVKTIADITIKNNTNQETDSRRAESLNLLQLKIRDNVGTDINGLIIKNEQGCLCDKLVLLPMEQAKLIIMYNPQNATDEFVGKLNLYYNDVKVDLPKSIEVSINKRELAPAPIFKFDSVPNCRYEVSDFVVGSIHISKDEIKVDCNIPRTYERFVINDDSKTAYYFLFGNGQKTTELNITSPGTIACKLVAIAKECLNDEIQYDIPISYFCDWEKDPVPMVGEIRIWPNKEKPCFELSVQDRANTRTLIDLNKKESVKVKCSIDMNTELAKIFVFKLCFANKASIPYKDWGVKISKLKIEDKRNSLSYYNREEQFSLFNGGDELFIPISIPQEILRNGPCSISVYFKYDDKLLDRRIDIDSQWVTRDGWVSLDLGTSGIVMAKLHKEPSGSVVNILELTDAEKDPMRCIESDSKIISSSIILNKEREVVFCPSKTDFKRALFQFVPIKFIIGQEIIPFKSNLLMVLESLQAPYFSINKEECTIEMSGLPKKIIDFVYEDILRKRINKVHVDSITKFILTYPNTYVPKQLAVIRKNLEDIMSPNIVPVEFVPESDAIVAHYLKMRLQGQGFKTAKEIGKEKIVIYDMGAGTLDISYVELLYDAQEQQYTATICNRVGAPLGGNYLDALFYNYLEDKLELQGESERERLLNARDFIWFLKKRCSDDNLGKRISDIIKIHNDEKDKNGKNKNEQINVVLNNKSSSVLLSDLLSDSIISGYISLCTESILFYMLNQARNYRSNLGNQKEWLRKQVDTVILSGRGSQFVPIQKKLEEIFTQKKLDDNTIIDDIKTGVAKGAIEYCQIIGSRNQYRFSIRNQNQYLRIGILYNGVNEFDGLEKKYVECIDPTQVNWADIIPENGTRYMTFNNTVTLNLRRVESICFVQTVLPVSEVEPILTQPTHIHWSLINELFTIRINGEFVDPESVEVNIQIDKNSQVIIKMNGDEYLPLSGLENIELNKCYAMSAWPFNKPLR